MAENSKIAWTDHTWNPWQGCHKVSPGCLNCYMYRDKKRYGQDASIVVRSKDATFNKPLLWDDPAMVFVCSWSDFFIEDADEWRDDAWEIMKKTPHLTYLLLTKRPENIKDRLPEDWGEGYLNVWLGVTAENQEEANRRIPILLKTPATKRFISIEPMLENIDIKHYLDGMPEPYSGGVNYVSKEMASDACCPEMEGMPIEQEPEWRQTAPPIDWIIVGAESGPNRRPCKIEWIRDIVRQCKEASVPVFVKQMEINGKITADPSDWPEDLRIQEFPK